jgi:Methyltransferase domain
MSAIGRLRTIPGTLPESVGALLADLAGQVPAELAIIDIGAGRGRSTCYLAFGARNGGGAHVYAADTAWDRRGQQLAWLSVRQEGLRGQVTLLDGAAEEAAANWEGPKVALLHVAGDEFDRKTAVAAWRRHFVDRALIAWRDGDTVRVETVEEPPKAQKPKDPSEPSPKQEDLPEPVIEHGTVEVIPESETVTIEPAPVSAEPPKEPEPDGLESLTVPKLLQLGRSQGAKVDKNMRKRDIIATIRAHRAPSSQSRSRLTQTGQTTSRISSTG